MKIKNYKKKLISLSLIFMLTGLFISILGFGLNQFSLNRVKELAQGDIWYQTIHVNSSDHLWYGIDLGEDIHLFVLGDSE